MNRFVFDVDGTLTPSRSTIDPYFASYFEGFCEENPVYLVTGSDYPKTIEQLGETICNKVKRIYNCSGNDVWEQGVNVRTNDWTLPDLAREWLTQKLDNSEFVLRTGNHIEDRPGCVNFSVVGRNATLGERMLYVNYDKLKKERTRIANEFNYIFGLESMQLHAAVGGDTGIDIYQMGSDKSQILKDFSSEDRIIFFGDKMEPGGNDYPLMQSNPFGTNYPVKDWNHTWELLETFR